MLWLALHLPWLPLERFAGASDSHIPFAVSTGHGARLVAANAAARRLGVHPGQTATAARALAAALVVHERDEVAEQTLLEGLAAWAGQYTSRVSLESPHALLLEVEGSLALFGGLDPLWARVEEGIAALGHRARLAAAPTPRAALWLARAGTGARVTDALQTHLEALDLTALELPAEQVALLAGLGLRTLGDCLHLPRAGLARRLGTGFVTTLDQALGRSPDPRPAYQPPPRFESRLELPAEVEHTEALLFAARRLLGALCGQLTAREAGVAELRLVLHHREAATTVRLGLLAPSRDEEKLMDLLRERLGRVELAQPVVALTLNAEALLPLPGYSGELFPGPRAQAEAGAALLERLRARLGVDAVQGLTVVADHRPERAWRAVVPGEGGALTVPGERPLWLLTEPLHLTEKDGVPWLDGPLILPKGNERIESGWWDGLEQCRDYLIARDPDGTRYWLFHNHDGGWFLHGFFS